MSQIPLEMFLIILTIILKNINYEVLIINDFSKDDTLEKTKNLINNYKNFKVFDNNKKGLGGAINLGIKKIFREKCSDYDGRSVR